MAERSIPDIAREALRLLATRKMAPTPENYQSAYEEVAGYLPKPPFPSKALRQIYSVLPTHNAVLQRIALHFNQAINDQNWHGIQQAIVAYANLDQLPVAAPAPHAVRTTEMLSVLPPELAEQIARVVENILPMLSEDEDRRMHELTDQLVNFLRVSPPSLQDLLHMLQNFAYRLSFSTEDQAQRRLAIHSLLRTVVTHTAEMHKADPQLQTLSQQLLQAMEQPWTLRHLDALQEQLQTLLLRQMDVQGQTEEAQDHIKSLLAESLQHMSTLTESSSVQTAHIEQCASQLQQAAGLEQLTPILAELVTATHAIAAENRIAHAALQDLRDRSSQEQQSIERLQATLSTVQQVTHHDPLTRCLNAQGLDDALARELARANRHHTPLSLVSISLDGLHALTLAHGEAAKDHAQQHFASVVRSVVRPQDWMARTDDNRFFLVLPGANVDAALSAMIRLQEALPKRPLLQDDDKIALAMNAGVVQAWPSEAQLDLINRADQSLQNAQMAGPGGRLARG